jgi:phosphatidate cytidylyltransferase
MKQTFTVGLELLAAVYVGFGLSYLVLLRGFPGSAGLYYVLLTFIITWLCDSSAYLVGIRCGKNKLCPRFSPKKSREGAIAGIVGAAVGALLMNLIVRECFSILSLSAFDAVILGILCSVVGEFGDLFESMLKRDAKIKDSGNAIPGHGGMLDRFDSLLFIAPAAYFYIIFFVI